MRVMVYRRQHLYGAPRLDWLLHWTPETWSVSSTLCIMNIGRFSFYGFGFCLQFSLPCGADRRDGIGVFSHLAFRMTRITHPLRRADRVLHFLVWNGG